MKYFQAFYTTAFFTLYKVGLIIRKNEKSSSFNFIDNCSDLFILRWALFTIALTSSLYQNRNYKTKTIPRDSQKTSFIRS